MSKLNILITRFPYQSQLGGEELHTLHLAESLVKKGHNVRLLTSDPVLSGLFKENALEVKEIVALRPPVTILSLIIFTFLSPIYFFYLNWFLIGFWRDNKKNNDKNVLYSLSLGEKLIMSPVAKLLRFNVVWIEHARIGGWLTKNPWVIIYRLWAMFSQIIVPSKQTAYPIKWAKNVNIIAHGVKFDKSIKSTTHNPKNRKNNDKTDSKFDVLCVARLSQDKGVDYLISAFLKLINHNVKARLHIVGSGPEKVSLHKMVKELHIDKHIKFSGKIPHKKLSKLFNLADTVVLPSTKHDPFGLVVVEALIMNKPVIMTKICGVSEYLENGVEALIVPERDEYALYQALNALATNQNFALKIAKSGHDCVEAKFSHERMVENYEKVFNL